MTRNSRVTNKEQLFEQTRKMIQQFEGSSLFPWKMNFVGALIEEFIEGREFTVLVAENPEEPDVFLSKESHFLESHCF